MRLALKYTQTLIGSRISSIYIPNIYRNLPEDQEGQTISNIVTLVLAFVVFSIIYLISATPIYAIVDPLAVPNNKFGIHIISATNDELSPAKDLVNTNGDWGYITVLIESKDRNEGKWQEFFGELRRKHLIPIVRITTQPEGNYWKRPYEGEETAWADFLDKLNWPIKNRYVTIYNEPNHATEWGNQVDARNYAQVLDKTITALKNKSPDFFVLNAGFDASAPQKLPAYQDQASFMEDMNSEIPGIFNKLDGWVSHPYPNPGFVGSPDGSGRTSVRAWVWEQQVLRRLGVSKNLPIFITETGWKHSSGITKNNSFPSPEKVAEYYKNAFENAWTSNQIVAVTPFLLNYQQPPFDQFSFKKITGEKQTLPPLPTKDVLAAEYPDYHPQYLTLKNMPKVSGHPIQENKAELDQGAVYTSMVAGESYNIAITVKNSGQSIWNEYEPVQLRAIQGSKELGFTPVSIPLNKKVEPGQEHTFTIHLKAPQAGNFKTAFNLFVGDKEFGSTGWSFTTEVKSPVILQVRSKLQWKDNPAGEYILNIAGAFSNTIQNTPLNVFVNGNGSSGQLEERFLIPDYTYDFTLDKPFYKPKTIRQVVKSGVNTLDFGQLQPDIGSAILKPQQLWKLLPFSN